jgi:hypothetical protein
LRPRQKAQPELPCIDSSALAADLVKSYRFVVLSMGNNGVLACPAVGADLQQALARLLCRFDEALSPRLVQETGSQINDQLDLWGGRAAEYFKAKTGTASRCRP